MRRIREHQEEFNRKHYPGGDPERIYVEGDLVMVRDQRLGKPEFSAKWLGPCRITRRLSSEVYEVEREGDVVKIHVDKLRPAPRGNPEQEDIDEDSSSDGESSDSDLSEAERTEEKDEPQQAGEEVQFQDRGAAAARSPRTTVSQKRGVAKRKTVFDTVTPIPGTSREPDRYVPSSTQIITLDPQQYLEDQERRGGVSHPDRRPTIDAPTPPSEIGRPAQSAENPKEKHSESEPQENKQEQQQERQKPKKTPSDTVTKETPSATGKGSSEPRRPPGVRPPAGRKRRARLIIKDAPSE